VTRVLLIVNSKIMVCLEQSLPAADLARAAQTRAWLPPPPIDGWLPRGTRYGVHQVDDTVIIFLQKRNDQKEGEEQPGSAFPSLTKRQIEVIYGIAQGLSTKEIALNLSLARRTVQHHLSMIRSLTGCQTRTEMVRLAFELGVIQPSRQESRQNSYNPNLPPSPSESNVSIT
jgi:DNA-binding CsgD family transcriptional regulator